MLGWGTVNRDGADLIHTHTEAYTHNLRWGVFCRLDWGHNLACGFEMISGGMSLIGRSLFFPPLSWPPTSVLSQLLWGDSGGGW